MLISHRVVHGDAGTCGVDICVDLIGYQSSRIDLVRHQSVDRLSGRFQFPDDGIGGLGTTLSDLSADDDQEFLGVLSDTDGRKTFAEHTVPFVIEIAEFAGDWVENEKLSGGTECDGQRMEVPFSEEQVSINFVVDGQSRRTVAAQYLTRIADTRISGTDEHGLSSRFQQGFGFRKQMHVLNGRQKTYFLGDLSNMRLQSIIDLDVRSRLDVKNIIIPREIRYGRMAEMDQCLCIVLVSGEKVAGPITRVTQNKNIDSEVFRESVRDLSGPDLKSFWKLEGDRVETSVADPAFNGVDLKIEKHQ